MRGSGKATSDVLLVSGQRLDGSKQADPILLEQGRV